MTIEEFRAQLNTEPFRRFRIHLADGRSKVVEHPDFVACSPDRDSAILYGLDGTWELIDLYLVTGLEVLRNGKPRRGKPTRKTR